MARLVFNVEADYQKVMRLREEITRLKSEMKNFDGSRVEFDAMNRRIGQAQIEMSGLVRSAADAGNVLEKSLKQKIFDSAQVTNELTKKIIAQKGVIKDVEKDVKALGDAYHKALKAGQHSKASTILGELTAAKGALQEEKNALFGLTQQQASARLSTKELRDEMALYKDESKEVIQTTDGMGISFGKMFAVLGGAAALKSILSNMISIRGEFRRIEVGLETMTGKAKAASLLKEIKEYAAESPLELKGISGATQTMIGFNVEAEKVPQYIRAIGDVSQGDGAKFQSLTLAFSQVSAAGKLMGQDLNQMINAGFNPLSTISEKTGKSISVLKDEMSKGAISADMVKQAFIDATSEGGKFFNMSQNASKELAGQMSMLQDAIDNAFNDMGEKSEGFLMTGIQATTELVKNYEQVGKVLTGLVAVYGTYRTAMILNTVVEQGFTKAVWSKVTATKAATVAQAAFNKVVMLNPYVAVGAAIVSIGIAMWAFADSTTAAEKAQKKLNERHAEAARKADEHKRKIEGLVDKSRDLALADLERTQSLAELRKEYPKIFAKYDIESIKLADILKLKKEIAEEDSKRAGERKREEFSNLEGEISYYENLIKSLSGQKGVDGYIKKLDELRLMRDTMLQDNGKNISEQFISSLKDIDISQFDKYIEELERRIKGKNGKVTMKLPIDVQGTMSDAAIYEVKDIQALIDTAKSTKDSRIEADKNKTNYKEDLAVAKKEWENAKKELAAIEKDKEKFSSEQYKNAKAEADAKEKAYKDLGGDTNRKTFKDEKDGQEALQNELLALQRKTSQAQINLMEEGSERKIKQLEENYKNELEELKKQEAKWRKEQHNILTTDQEASLLSARGAAKGTYEKGVSGVASEQEKEFNQLIGKYKDFAAKRKSIEDSFNSDIDKLNKKRTSDNASEIDRAIEVANELKEKEVQELESTINKTSTILAKMFEDTSSKSVVEIDRIIYKSELLMKYLSAIKDGGTADIEGSSVSRDDIMNIGISEESLKMLESSPEAIEALSNAIKKLKGDLGSRSPFLLFKSQVKDAIESIKGGDLAGGISGIGSAVSKFAPEVAQFGKDLGNIVGNDDLGNKIAGVAQGLGGLGQTASGVGQIMSGDIIGGSMAVVGGISKVVDALDGLFGADYSAYNKMVDEYAQMNSIWDELIDKKREYIDVSYGVEANKAAKEAEELQRKAIESNYILGRERLNSGASAGSSSIGVRIRKNMSEEGWREAQKALGQDFYDFGIGEGRMTGLFDLSVDQLEKLKSEAPTFWAKLDGDVRDYLDNIIYGAEKLEDIQNQVKESLTQISFDSVFDSFVNTLMNMDSKSEDFADDFAEYFQRAMLTTMMGNSYQDRLQAWYDNFAKANEDGNITAEEYKAMQDEYNSIVSDAVAERDALKEAMGWNSSSSQDQGSSRGFQATSQDTSDELNGRFTALQVTGEIISKQSELSLIAINNLNTTSESIMANSSEMCRIADESRTIAAESLLEMIAIRENTAQSAKYLKVIQSDIAEVKQNTSRL